MTVTTINKEDKVMMFIDLRNMTKSVKMDSQFFHLDFVAMAKQLRGDRQLIAAYVFDSKGVMESEKSTRRFHHYLRYNGFRVVARNSYDPDMDEQKEVDVAMACKMVVHALKDHYDVAVVVSGDRDFVPAIQEVQAAGKRVEVAAFDSSVSSEMIRSADRFHRLETMPLLTMFNPDPNESVDDPAGSEEGTI